MGWQSRQEALAEFQLMGRWKPMGGLAVAHLRMHAQYVTTCKGASAYLTMQRFCCTTTTLLKNACTSVLTFLKHHVLKTCIKRGAATLPHGLICHIRNREPRSMLPKVVHFQFLTPGQIFEDKFAR